MPWTARIFSEAWWIASTSSADSGSMGGCGLTVRFQGRSVIPPWFAARLSRRPPRDRLAIVPPENRPNIIVSAIQGLTVCASLHPRGKR